MIKYRTKLIEKLTHGKSVSHLIKTLTGKSKPPEVVTCFGSYKVNTRPLIDWQAPSSDESRRQIRLHFTYSRNNGPIQRVMIDENTEDWDAIDLLYSKLDTDLCRAQDGESLAFYLLSDSMGLAEQVIPELNDIQSHPVPVPPIELTRMTMASVPEQPDYDYTITGIGGDGLIPIPNVFNIDSRNISIPHPFSAIDSETVDWMAWPRWYPSNTIVKEDNTIVIYPSEGIESHDFDLFSALGGVGNTPITINSCVKAVPRKYNCTASHVVGSQVRSQILTRLALSESGVQSTAYRSPVRFSDTPFPFDAAGNWSGQNGTWPPNSNWEGGDYGQDWVATYRRNDGPLKFITWNTGSRNPGSHHSVWDAIKELILDDYGRTAFMLSDFNSTMSSHNGDGDITVKSGLTSNLTFIYSPHIEGNPTHQSQQSYRYAGKSVEVRDRQIQFSDESAGAVWNENTITIYPTPWEVINDYGFDGQLDYYEYLCQYGDQLEAGEPITIHSCAAVEPADHIQVNTSITLNSPEEEEVPRMMGQGLSAAIRLNDGAVRYFKYEPNEVNVALNEILTYLYFMGKTPEVTISQGDGTVLKINDLYFRSNFTAHSSEISGCSGTERDQEFWMPVGNPMDYEDPNSTPRVSILETPESYKRESNKATFIKHPVNGYTDLFDLIKYTSGDEHTIYSSAVVPSVIWGRIDDSEEPGGDGSIDDLEDEYMQWREPWVFSITKTNGMGESFNPTISAVYGTDFVIVDHDTGERLASTFGRTHEGIIQRIPENNNLDIIFDMDKLNTSRTFELYFGITGGSVIFGNDTTKGSLKEGELEIIEWNSDCAPKVRISAANMTVKLPQTLPKEWTRLNSMLAYANMANPDISMWDVSHVVDMDYMFENTSAFNQDLSSWCVQRMSIEPYNFRKNATKWTLPKPVWGTCPSDVPTAIGDTLEFTIDPDSTISPNSKFTITLGNAGDNWTLANESGVIATPTYREQDIVISGGVPSNTLTINNLANRYGKYILTTTSDRINLRSGSAGDSGPANMRVNVSKFSDTVNSYGFTFPTAMLTVPTTLPSSVTNCDEMFYHCKYFDQDISMWDTSNVTTMIRMFNHAQIFNQSLNTWDVSNVVTMESMFLHAYKFNGEIGNWNTGNVTNMHSMFNAARTFNQDIGNWDVSNVTTMRGMFFDTPHFNQDLSRWCVTNISETPISFTYYENAWILPKPVWGTCPAPKPDLPDGTPLEFNIYSPSTNNPVIPLTITIKSPESGWKLYENNILVCSRWTNGPGIYTINDNSGLITIQIDRNNLMDKTVNYKLFAKTDRVRVSRGYSNLTGTSPSIDVISFSDSCASQAFGFEWANLTVPTVLPPCITNAHAMFENCRKFNQDLSMWDTSNILYMSNMFATCSNFNGDVSTWDVSNVVMMESMFARATNFNQDLSGWNVVNIPTEPNNFAINATQWTLPKPVWGSTGTPVVVPPPPMPEYTPFEFNVTSSGGAGFALETSGNPTEWMLYQDDVLITTEETRTNHRVSDLKEGVTNFKLFTDGGSINMREGSAGTNTTIDFLSFCEAVPRTNFSIQSYNFTVPKTLPANHTDLRDMFKGCNAFNQDLSEWDTSRVTDMSQMFYETSVFNGNITTWNTSQVTNFTRMFSSARVFNQDISNWDVSNALYMGGMFDIALVFNQPIGNWDIAKVTSTQDMFKNAWEFNQDLSSWNVSNVQSMDGMFFVAKAFNQDLSGWNVAHIPDEPVNFANLAAAWSEPKPVWGTVGTPKV